VIELVIKGVVTGFLLSIMVGPVFFVLLETSIRRGVRAALAFDLGVLLSDVIYVLVAFVFYAQVSAIMVGERQDSLKIVGGVLFIIYGIVTYIKKPKESALDEVGNVIHKSSDYLILALKGFFLNFANPLVIFYWFSVITLGAKSTANNEADHYAILYYIAVILVTFFSFDLLKIFGAKKLRPLVTDKVLIILNHFIGIVFAVFGIILLAQGILG
jgi:threonine/homoserine/homoserine lactone efflux protein